MSTNRRPVFHNADAAAWRASPLSNTDLINQFHRSLPGYEPTPLISLDDAAREIGVGAIHLKSEVSRLGLPAFKILGASWASFRSVAEKLGLPLDSDLDTVKQAAASRSLKLYCTTEGNHGRAVARMAKIMGLAAEVHVPHHMYPATIELIRSEGAVVVVSEGDYDYAIAEVSKLAFADERGILVQDYAFDDYRDVPLWVVDGYLTMMREVDAQLGDTTADLVVAPVGVGSFAHAVAAHFKQPAKSASVVTVEPDTAACLWKSLQKGKPTTVTTTPTIMAGLNCATPSASAWELFSKGVSASVTVSDYEAHRDTLYLHSQGIPAGPCGAATLAALRRLTPEDKKALGLNDKSTVVIFCTEGAREYDVPQDVAIDDSVALTQALVQIDSANPGLGSVPGPGETKVAEYVSAWLEHRDLEAHWVEPTKGRPSVVGVARGTGGGKSLMFNGHIDTVTLQGYADDPLSGKIVDGKLYGRGAADMKSGVAACMVALSTAKTLGLRGDVVFTGVADEELASIGTEDVLRAGWRADAAVVAEPSVDLEIVHAHKGFVWLDVTVHGVAAHGSRADAGVDSIIHAGYFLAELGELERRLREGPADPAVGTGTVHASLIKGGEEISSYPAQCVISIERRTVPGETDEVVVRQIQDIIDKVAAERPQFKAEVRKTFTRPWQNTPKDDPFVEIVRDCVAREIGREPEVTGATFWTDCALLSAEGIIPLLWGPIGVGLHSKEEYADVKSITDATRALTNIAKRFCA